MRSHRAFSMIELLAVLGIIVLLMSLLIPTLRGVHLSALRTKCLNNIRMLELAHVAYATDHRGAFVDMGLPHGGTGSEESAWINTLREYYGGPDYHGETEEEEEHRYQRNELILRSPLDRSPHWSKADGGQGVPIPGSTDRFRRTSYGGNNYLSRSYSFDAALYGPAAAADRLSKVLDPAATVHFLIMVFQDDYGFCGSDHVHVEEWWINPPVQAASQTQTNAYRGREGDWMAQSNYGFLDGHVATLEFNEVYLPPHDRDGDGSIEFDDMVSRFDPKISNRFNAIRAVISGEGP